METFKQSNILLRYGLLEKKFRLPGKRESSKNMPWMKCDAFHVVCVPHVVPLLVCLHVVKNHHGSNWVTNLAWAGKAENVATPACLPSPVPINPFHIKVKFGSLQFKIRVPAFLQLWCLDWKKCYVLFSMFQILASISISIHITIYLWELWTQPVFLWCSNGQDFQRASPDLCFRLHLRHQQISIQAGSLLEIVCTKLFTFKLVSCV